MSRPYHQVLEIIALIKEVIINAEEWNIDELKTIAAVGQISNTKVVIKNTKHLSYNDFEYILSVKGSFAENTNIVLEL